MRPVAKEAATARTGYSSIMLGARSAGTSTPSSGPARTSRSATGSPPASRGLSISILAPISRSVATRPVRSSFMPTFSMRISEPGSSSAATIGNAAEEGSPGTTRSAALSSTSPRSVIRRWPSAVVTPVTMAPKWRSIRSVWSRVASGSTTVVSPGAFKPASRIADFTCAEGTGSV